MTEFFAGITPQATVKGVAAGPDGNLWFTEHGLAGDRIARITPAGVVTELPLPPGTEPGDIARGPDGNLWFTAGHLGAGRVGRITPAGTMTEFSAGITPGSDLCDITSGPDGNLWFTELQGRIGRITPTGTVSEFSANVPSSSASPCAITAGPDANLWFTGGAGPDVRVGRVTTAGRATVFSAGITQSGGLGEITAGPDGNLWFVGNLPAGAGQIGRITTAGAVSEFVYATVHQHSGLEGMTRGPDGNLWFTDSLGHVIGQITTAGTITRFPFPPVNQVMVRKSTGKIAIDLQVTGRDTFNAKATFGPGGRQIYGKGHVTSTITNGAVVLMVKPTAAARRALKSNGTLPVSIQIVFRKAPHRGSHPRAITLGTLRVDL